jgi:hypothetical protein
MGWIARRNDRPNFWWRLRLNVRRLLSVPLFTERLAGGALVRAQIVDPHHESNNMA